MSNVFWIQLFLKLWQCLSTAVPTSLCCTNQSSQPDEFGPPPEKKTGRFLGSFLSQVILIFLTHIWPKYLRNICVPLSCHSHIFRKSVQQRWLNHYSISSISKTRHCWNAHISVNEPLNRTWSTRIVYYRFIIISLIYYLHDKWLYRDILVILYRNIFFAPYHIALHYIP